MMKKKLLGSLILSAFLACGFAACGEDTDSSTDGGSTSPVVTPDTTAPVFGAIDESGLSGLVAGDSFTVPTATATDETSDVSITVTLKVGEEETPITMGGEIVAENAGTYVLTYTATDASGNFATETVEIVVAEPDTTAPVFAAIDKSGLSGLVAGDSFTVPTATATDETSDVTITVTLKAGKAEVPTAMGESVTAEFAGTYVLTYTATDASGNFATETVEIVVTEKTFAYTVEHYFENADGEYVLDEELTENLSDVAGTEVSATAKTVDGYAVDLEHAETVANATLDADGKVLKLYYVNTNLVNVTIDLNNGTAATTVRVLKGTVLEEPETPSKKYCSFSGWEANGESFDFATEISGEITIVAVYEENSRYAHNLVVDGTASSYGMDRGSNYEDEVYIEQNGDLVDLTVINGVVGETYMTLDREGKFEQPLLAMSDSQYVGFNVYAPKSGTEIQVIFVLTNKVDGGNTALKYKYRLAEGWNEVIINLPELAREKAGITDMNSTNYPIYRFGIGVTQNYFKETNPSAESVTVSVGKVYSTNMDMANFIGFDSVGDVNRYEFATKNSYADIDYAVKKSDTSSNSGTTVEYVEMDGRTVLKVNKGESFIAYQFKFGNGAWFNNDVSGYSKMLICARVDQSANFKATVGGTSVNYTTLNLDAEGNKIVGEWFVYEVDLTDVSSITKFEFEVWGADCVYFDYIEFVK